MTSEVFLNGRVTLHIGDVRAKLRELPADHFDCVVSSPPYWGLRNYGTGHWVGGDVDCEHERVGTERTPWANSVKGPGNPGKNGETYANMTKTVGGHCAKCASVYTDFQIGMEPTLAEHISVMVDVFREVRRALKPTGVCWINYGDCYATAPNGRSAADTKAAGNDDRTFRDKPFSTIQGTLKSKDLCMIPERLFIALQDDGWWVRSKMPWIKRNGMPESITDRPANSLEQVAMLTKSERYWYDADAIRKAASASTNQRIAQNVAAQAGSESANGLTRIDRPMKAVVRKPGVTPKSAGEDTNIKAKASFHASTTEVLHDRNFRNTDLFFSSLEAPWGLISDGDDTPLAIDANPQGFSEAHFATFPQALIEPLILAGCPVGGEVLDPFGGAGTTALVSALNGRHSTIIELNPEYATLARARIEAAFMGKDEGSRHMVKQLGKEPKAFEAGTLFAETVEPAE
jgi:DNA modification methylase